MGWGIALCELEALGFIRITEPGRGGNARAAWIVGREKFWAQKISARPELRNERMD
jgi:hypothetical protein